MQGETINTSNNWEKYVYTDRKIGAGIGENSRCYWSIYDNVFKKLNIDLSINSPKANIYFSLIKMKSDLFILPDNLLIKEKNLLGYFMKYMDAPTINNLEVDTKIQTILNDIDRVEYETLSISKHHVKLKDIHSRDVYFNGKFYIGDIDASIILLEEDPDAIFHSNIKIIYSAILAGIFNKVFFDYYNFVQSDEELSVMASGLVEGTIPPINFKLYIIKICEKIGLDASSASISQLREYLKGKEPSFKRRP